MASLVLFTAISIAGMMGEKVSDDEVVGCLPVYMQHVLQQPAASYDRGVFYHTIVQITAMHTRLCDLGVNHRELAQSAVHALDLAASERKTTSCLTQRTASTTGGTCERRPRPHATQNRDARRRGHT